MDCAEKIWEPTIFFNKSPLNSGYESPWSRRNLSPILDIKSEFRL